MDLAPETQLLSMQTQQEHGYESQDSRRGLPIMPRTSTTSTSQPLNTTELRYLDSEQVGAILRVSSRQACKYLQSGFLKGFRVGKNWLTTPENVDAFVRSRAR